MVAGDSRHGQRRGTLNPQIQERILTLLDRVERERGIEILYACESGSRAWGFASPDSDYILAQTYNVDGGNWMS